MSTDNHKTTFWEFLGNYSIEIPIIQRDYAQGREGKESLRKSFLEDLKDALDQQKEMKLDFVYGSTENGKLYPLDGQQRLTTLWLLHWYIALKSGKLKEAADRLKKFTYETRISSRSFCEELCNPEHFEKLCNPEHSKNFDCSIGIVEFITNQTWFYSAWKQDPTIQSMLRMLGDGGDSEVTDGLEKAFNYSHRHPSVCQHRHRHLKQRRFIRYYNKLTTTRCPIVFYYLEKDFGNSDDLYIKMNARGEQLTSFENFKADLIGYITKQAENNEDWKKLLDPENGIPISMDTDWTDVFWKNKSIGTDDGRMVNRIDEIYFAFLNRFFWNELFIAKDGETYILNIGKGDKSSTQENENVSYKYLNDSDNPNDYDKKLAYKGLDPYKYFKNSIPLEFFQKLQRVMGNLTNYLNKYALPECAWDKGFFFIPEYVQENKKNKKIKNNSSEDILEVTVLTQVQRIVFFAICKYFDYDGKSYDDEESLKRWLQVVWNLVSGEDKNGYIIRSTQAMRSAIECINTLFINPLDNHNAYQSLNSKLDNGYVFRPLKLKNSNLGVLDSTEFGERCKEEMAKAHQIIIDNPRDDGRTWQKVIEEAENTAFFKGSIRFLFQDASGAIDWSNFDEKWENAKRYFEEPNGGNKKLPNSIELAKYFEDDDVKQLWKQYSFTTDSKTWKALLLTNNPKQIHNFLMKTTAPKSDLIIDIENLMSKIQKDLWLRDWHTDNKNIFLTDYNSQVAKPENGYVYMVGDRRRNRLIFNMQQSGNMDELIFQKGTANDVCFEIKGIHYYRGLVVDFKYNNMYYFRLWENNTICLMTNDWASKILKDANQEAKPENTYFFIVTVESVDEIGEQLDGLIDKYNRC